MRELFDEFGIDYRKAAEVAHVYRTDSGLHEYHGWFHLVGQIESGADAWRQVDKEGKSFTGELEPFTEQFQIGFTSRLALVREPFQGRPLVQLEFAAHVPWVIDHAEPS